MFTSDQIKAAHSKVKSGADFPAYIQEIKALGVTHYEAYVSDGHLDYHGLKGHHANVAAKYDTMSIADHVNEAEFRQELLAHQQGKTDYLSFIHMCATCGIDKWTININNMTCTYFDKRGNEVLIEKIPG